ncbi:phage tail length tape measure family protein [Glaciihabitans sp. UYNi722]|uniref:phage tail length tape measure family protein n=1 Tax=Glaciihabitans sp. UYNi722 TaxID=3156344 RepID=UPI00339B18D6
MTLSAGQVSLTVKSDTKGFGKKLADDINKEAKSSGLSGIGKAIGGTIVAGLAVGLAGISAIVGTGIKETLDASAGTAQLAAGIKSTGNAANVSVKGMNDLASSIQNMSGQTDDSIVKAQGLLLTFTSIKNQGPDKIFDQATQAAADMAAKFGGDASSQAILLGKALNDPVKGITALTRVGVSFTQGQKDTIAAMVKTGDTVGAQKVILKELNTEFGGAAKAAGESLPGQLARGQRAFEDMSQSVVETFLPLVIPAITKVAGVLRDLTPVIQSAANWVRDHLAAGFKEIQPQLTAFWSVVTTNILPALKDFGDWVVKNGRWLLEVTTVVVAAIVAYRTIAAVVGIVKIAMITYNAVIAVSKAVLIGATAASYGAEGATYAVGAAQKTGYIITAIFNGTLWKQIAALIASKVETAALVAMYAGDFFVAVGKNIAGTVASTAAWVANAAAQIGAKAVIIGGAIAMGVATAAQWLWNAAMDANPIGIIIVAIGALVAGIIWVATQTTFFQDTWKGMTILVGIAWNWLWTNIIQPVVNFIVGYVHMLGGVFSWLWANVIKPVADWIGAAIGIVGSVIGTVFGTIGDVIRGGFNGVVSFVKGIFNTIIGLVNGIIDGINSATSVAAVIGIKIGAIPHLPKLAASGTVLPTPGGTLAVIAEGGKAESVVDTGKLNNLMDAASAGGGQGKGGGNVYIDKVVAPDQNPQASGRIMGREFIRVLAGAV